MRLCFEWETSTAKHHMHNVLKQHNIENFDDGYGSLCAVVKGEKKILDYKHVSGNTFEIVEKKYRYRQEPEILAIEF